MYAGDPALEDPTLDLPADLVAERRRSGTARTDFRVEGWKPTLMERLARMLGLV
jgi:hypothetical protein